MQTAIISLNSVNQLIFVMMKCFLCGTDRILKYYLNEFRLRMVNATQFLSVPKIKIFRRMRPP
jgi:hypothetical protein